MLEQATAGAGLVPERLKLLAELRGAMAVGCEWCLDYGSSIAAAAGISEAELRALPNYASSDLFGELEKLVLDYATAISRTPVQVSDELFARLAEHFDEPQLVELTSVIALENFRARFNWAFGLAGQGYSEGAYCVRPESRVAETAVAERLPREPGREGRRLSRPARGRALRHPEPVGRRLGPGPAGARLRGAGDDELRLRLHARPQRQRRHARRGDRPRRRDRRDHDAARLRRSRERLRRRPRRRGPCDRGRGGGRRRGRLDRGLRAARPARRESTSAGSLSSGSRPRSRPRPPCRAASCSPPAPRTRSATAPASPTRSSA